MKEMLAFLCLEEIKIYLLGLTQVYGPPLAVGWQPKRRLTTLASLSLSQKISKHITTYGGQIYTLVVAEGQNFGASEVDRILVKGRGVFQREMHVNRVMMVQGGAAKTPRV